MSDLNKKIEAVLFVSAEPRKIGWLAKFFGVSKEEIDKAVAELSEILKNRGIRLINENEEALLAVAPEHADLVENLVREEISSDLTKAGLETLTIIVYKGPISRSDIEYIRGVNSSYTLRNLLIRGLIEKISDPNRPQEFLYRATLDFMRLIGIVKKEELPDFENFNEKLEKFLSENKETKPNSNEIIG